MAIRFHLKAREGLPAPPSLNGISDQFLTVLAMADGEAAEIERILGVDLGMFRRITHRKEAPQFQDVASLCRAVEHFGGQVELHSDSLVGIPAVHAGGFPTRAAVEHFAADLSKFRQALQAVEDAGTSVVAFVR